MIIEAEYEEVEPTGEELDLSEDDSLPWLEADEEDESAGGVDTAQIIGFALILLTLLALVVGAVWYATNGTGNPDLEPDGSTIRAPESPIRERPEDPQGRELPGTGDVAPAVGEGQVREGVMDTDPADQPTTPSDEPTDKPVPVAAAEPTGVGVQLAAYRSRARAEQGWNDIRSRTSALNGVRYRIEEGTVDIGTVYRLQAVASDRAAADRLCAALKADGLDCQVKP